MERLAKKLGPKLSEIRESRGLTQEDLEEISGVPRRTIQNIEHGQTKDPGIYTILKLLAALNCSWDDLADSTPTKSAQFASAGEFLSTFAGSPPDIQKLIFSILYKDADYVKDLPDALVRQATILLKLFGSR